MHFLSYNTKQTSDKSSKWPTTTPFTLFHFNRKKSFTTKESNQLAFVTVAYLIAWTGTNVVISVPILSTLWILFRIEAVRYTIKPKGTKEKGWVMSSTRNEYKGKCVLLRVPIKVVVHKRMKDFKGSRVCFCMFICFLLFVYDFRLCLVIMVVQYLSLKICATIIFCWKMSNSLYLNKHAYKWIWAPGCLTINLFTVKNHSQSSSHIYLFWEVR